MTNNPANKPTLYYSPTDLDGGLSGTWLLNVLKTAQPLRVFENVSCSRSGIVARAADVTALIFFERLRRALKI